MAAQFASPALGPDALKSAHSRLDKLKICGECQGLGMVKQTDGGKGALHIVRDVNCSKCRGEGMIFVGPPAEREAFYAEANRKPSTEGLAAAVSLKDEGDALAKSGDWAKAAAKYSEARGLDRCYLPALANRALCHLKLADFGKCVADCSYVIATADKGSALRLKAHLRRATASVARGERADMGVALDDLATLLRAQPGHPAAKKLLEEAQTKEAAFLAAEKEALLGKPGDPKPAEAGATDFDILD